MLIQSGCALEPIEDPEAQQDEITTASLQNVNKSDIELVNNSDNNLDKLSDEYKIGAQDLLSIEVFQVEDFSLTVRVNRHGLISLPLIGKIKATGQTSEQLQKRIASRLSDTYLQSPHVIVFIKEYTSQRVTVEGSVNKPGIFPITGRTTLLQMIATAQGLTNLANKSEVTLYRAGSSESKNSFIFDITAIRKGESEDPVVRGNDVIVVQNSAPRSFLKSVTDTIRGFIFFGNPFD